MSRRRRLSTYQADAIKEEWRRDTRMSQSKLAEKYNVSRSVIRRIITNETYTESNVHWKTYRDQRTIIFAGCKEIFYDAMEKTFIFVVTKAYDAQSAGAINNKDALAAVSMPARSFWHNITKLVKANPTSMIDL